MKAKDFICLGLLLGLALTGCSTSKFTVFGNRTLLIETNRVVVQATCLEANGASYLTFSQRHFGFITAFPGNPMPLTHWYATFRVDQMIKGNFSESTFTISDAVAPEEPSWSFFEAGGHYIIGFNHCRPPRLRRFAVLAPDKANLGPLNDVPPVPYR